MVTTESSQAVLGSAAPSFSLPDTRTEQTVTLEQFTGQPLLVAFMCNHCPYVIHLLETFCECAAEFATRNVATVAISANDALRYPADSPDNMRKLAAERGFTFAYCHDESQSVARAYDAVCTPDMFLYDVNHTLYYRGQFDDSRPGSGQATGNDLIAAVTQMLNHQPPPRDTRPGVGCSIKWKAE